MAISDLQARQGKVEIIVEITDKGEVREFEKFGKTGRVCNVTAKDTTGEIKVTLWNEQIDQVNVGDTIKISNGYVSEYQGEKQLTTGKFGSLEVVDKSSGTSVEKGTEEQSVQASLADEKEEEETESPVTSDEKVEEEVLDESETVPVSPEATATEDEIVDAAEETVEEEKI